jgi:hypothetical protein
MRLIATPSAAAAMASALALTTLNALADEITITAGQRWSGLYSQYRLDGGSLVHLKFSTVLLATLNATSAAMDPIAPATSNITRRPAARARSDWTLNSPSPA